MSLEEAVEHHPNKSTYVIRIFSSGGAGQTPLQDSKLYKKINIYTFDDNDTYPFRIESGPKWFDEQIAEEIIRGFSEHKEGVEALVVHCVMGSNRSPAIAIALNEIFSLGQDSNLLMQEFEDYNRHVYNTMKKAQLKFP